MRFHGQSLLQMAATRISGAQAPAIIAAQSRADEVQNHLKECGVLPQQIFLEPEGRGTAPAVAVAAHYFTGSGRDPLLLVMPSDHLIRRPAALDAAVQNGIARAGAGDIVMFGIAPRRPATGYGYIRRDGDTDSVAQFVEKPDRATARRFMREQWLWNSGIFLFAASAFLGRLRASDTALHDASLLAVTRAARRQNLIVLDEDSFRSCPAISIDRAVMEKEGRRTVIPVDMGWRDLGNPASFLAGLLGL